MEKKQRARRPSRYELSQTQWERGEDLLPGKAGDLGRTWGDLEEERLGFAIG
ncbi:hypothetical protein XTALMG727_0588 [Xanthomonas translucens pv. arrhenatheri LMG 727]|uniref:Uncharacterized protein n=1 Tax=Xanthomonas graminis pv. arrhenatheri LMG 727 TaxID=1195923 RepID=A0A0K2ZEJ3_9XANT|nr:hypothetical protein XTALMG727_0588 [Xanthomonas translucens pv. arrhenatheri LMG 727]